MSILPASSRLAAVLPSSFTTLLSASPRRPVALAVHALLTAVALVLLLGFYTVVEGAVERGPVKPRPLAAAGVARRRAAAGPRPRSRPAGGRPSHGGVRPLSAGRTMAPFFLGPSHSSPSSATFRSA
jgi:hypothetical protein